MLLGCEGHGAGMPGINKNKSIAVAQGNNHFWLWWLEAPSDDATDIRRC